MAGNQAALCHGDQPLIYCDVSKLPPRREHDHYATPPRAVRQILDWYQLEGYPAPRTVLDLGAGGGVYGRTAKELWPDCHVTGIEIRDVPAPPEYDRWIVGDLTTWQPDGTWDLICGNPPYKFTKDAVRLSLEALAPHGSSLQLLPLPFLAGQARARTIYRDNLLRSVIVCSKRLSFATDGSQRTGSQDLAHFLFQHHSQRPPSVHFLL